jgi:hypothetical protein
MKGEGSNIPDPDNTVYDTKGVSVWFNICF